VLILAIQALQERLPTAQAELARTFHCNGTRLLAGAIALDFGVKTS